MSDEPRFLYVKNWWKFQDYRYKRPAWIKLHADALEDPEFISLSEINQYRLIKLWLYASEIDGRLPGDPTKIGRRLGLYHRRSCSDLVSIFISKGFISQQDIRGTPNKKRAPEKSIEKSIDKNPPSNPPKGKTVTDYTADFLRIWEPYPRHDAKRAAFVAFRKMGCRNGEVDKILTMISRFKQTEQWQRNGGQYIPMLATFLNQRRFEDELFDDSETL